MLFLGGKRKKKKQRQRQRQLNQSLRPPGYAPAFGSAVAFGPTCCGTASDRALKRGGSRFCAILHLRGRMWIEGARGVWVGGDTPHVSDDEAVANMGHPYTEQSSRIAVSEMLDPTLGAKCAPKMGLLVCDGAVWVGI